jgi:hypothetical protein
MSEHENGPSGDEDLEAELHRMGDILESVAERFPPDSKEALAIRDAALAYQLVQMNKALRLNYEKWRAAFDGDISDEELERINAKLRECGIDPDELTDD